jgi:integrin beta 8
MRSDRPYREGRSAAAAADELVANAGTQFDPVVAATLVGVVRDANTPGPPAGVRRLLRRSPRLVALVATAAIGGTAMAAVPGFREKVRDVFGGGKKAAPVSAPQQLPGGPAPASGSTFTVPATAKPEARDRQEPATARTLRKKQRGAAGTQAAATTPAADAGEQTPLTPASSGTTPAPSGGDSPSRAGGETRDTPSSGSDPATPGRSEDAPGQTKSGPGRESAPGQTGSSPGKSEDAPGHSGESPGNSGSAPGQTGDAPGQSGQEPGNSGSAPGQTGETPGNSGSAPGQSQTETPGNSGSAPGQSQTETPGNSGNAPGQGNGNGGGNGGGGKPPKD